MWPVLAGTTDLTFTVPGVSPGYAPELAVLLVAADEAVVWSNAAAAAAKRA